jgi:AcrR family transcriptional regulator
MSKGIATKDRILERAVALASRDGLEGITIGTLADELELSKSGLYAHFGSKEELQVQVIERAAALFTEQVLRPTLRVTRGEPRLRELFERWLDWGLNSGLPGGCFITAAAFELDDHAGKTRDVLAATLEEWRATLERVVATGVEAGHFRRDLDLRQFGFDIYGIVLGTYLAHRMMRDRSAAKRAKAAFERLIQDARP